MINEDVKNLIIEGANAVKMSDENKKKSADKRKYFQTEFSKEKIVKLDKEHYFQGKGVKEGNFTYELEWGSKFLGSIGGGSVYKFGYEKDFADIKKLLIKILSAENSMEQFYVAGGELTGFSEEGIGASHKLKGVSRALIGKVLSIYFPDLFINLFGDQDKLLAKIYSDYIPEYRGVELYLRNNYLLLDIKNKYVPQLINDEFSQLLYKVLEPGEEHFGGVESLEEKGIEALEVQHYQALIHRNFERLFGGKLKYYDSERQNEKNGQFDTQEVGIMDILAIDDKNNLVVIELKRSSTDVTLGQLLRYMGWVNKNLCGENQKVKGIIISESKDNRLEYALSIVKDVSFRKMKLNVEIEES